MSELEACMTAGASLATATEEEYEAMRVELVLAPNEDEEPRRKLVFEMPGVPQAGDCVTISRPGQSGNTELLVSRTRWALDCPETGSIHHAGETVVGATNSVIVECEFVAGPFASEEHKRFGLSGAT
jgi:hypothetical protein